MYEATYVTVILIKTN